MIPIDKLKRIGSVVLFTILQSTILQSVSAETPDDLPIYSYDMEYTTEDITVNGHVDPSKNVGSRVTVIFPPRELLSQEISEEVSAIELSPTEGFYCSGLEENIPTNPELTHTDNNIATYRFQPIAGPDPEEQLVYKHLQGTVSKNLSTGEIINFVLEAPRSFKLSWLVKIKSMKIEVQCRPTPDGRTYAARTEVILDGSAAMQKFDETEITSISNVSFVGD